MKKSVLILVFTLGLLLRIIGADWGFPFLLHPDEQTIAEIPADMAARSSCDPAVYMRPDHIEIYINAALYHAMSTIKYGEPLTETFNAHKTFYYLLSRILVAILGTISIIIAYLIGKEYGEDVGIISAILFAVFPSYVGHSHYITSDIPLTLCVLITILLALKYLKKPSRIKMILLCASSALGLSVKYPGSLTLALIIAVILFRHYEDGRKMALELSKALLLFSLFSFIFSPYLFMNFPGTVNAIHQEARSFHPGADGLGWLGNLVFYANAYLTFSGMLMLLFFVVGLYSIVRIEKIYSVPTFFGFLYWVLLSAVPLHWERWALPMYTAPLLITAYGIAISFRKSELFIHSKKYASAACGTAFFAAYCKLLVVSMVVTAIFTLTDTRYLSYKFARSAGINEKNALYEGYTPFSPGSSRLLVSKGDVIESKGFVVLSSYTYKRFLNNKERFARQTQFYNQLFSLPLVKEFASVSDDNFADSSFWANKSILWGISFLKDYLHDSSSLSSGPTIRIYALRN